MTRKMISTMVLFATSTCLGFAAQGESDIPKPSCKNCIVEEEESGELPTPKPPVLEKCKKKKK